MADYLQRLWNWFFNRDDFPAIEEHSYSACSVIEGPFVCSTNPNEVCRSREFSGSSQVIPSLHSKFILHIPYKDSQSAIEELQRSTNIVLLGACETRNIKTGMVTFFATVLMTNEYALTLQSYPPSWLQSIEPFDFILNI